MKQAAIGYLAGIIDGEGYLGIINKGRDMRIVVTSTDRRLPLRLSKITGKGHTTLCKRKEDGRRIPSWQWLCLKRGEVISILQRIYPFMIVKQKQTRCLLTYADRFAYRFNSRKPMTTKEVVVACRFAEKVRSLNSRQKNKNHFSK